MNKNSVICSFINEHPQDWEQILDNKLGIKVKKDGDYAIFNYGITCDFYNPIVQEARGIIIDLEKLEVVCWPFRKFGNHTEGYIDDIDWESARVLEKVDGSIIKLWYDKKGEHWQFSTNGMIRAESANVDGALGLTYGMVIEQALKDSPIDFSKLDAEYTYIFELVSPHTRVVVNYGTTTFYHLGTRSNVTGKECETDVGVKKPKSYPLDSLSSCIEAAVALNRDGGDEVSNEGFVVVDKNYHRVKIKSPDYVMMHHLATMKTINKKESIQLLLYEREKIETVIKASPLIEPTIKFYDYKICELMVEADKICTLTRALYEEYSHDRKAVASVIARHRLAPIAFKALECDEKGREIWLAMPFDRMVKFVPDYEPEDLNLLFLSQERN